MRPRYRLAVFFTGAAGIVVLFFLARGAMRGPTGTSNRYAHEISSRTFAERNITDAVTAVNFDYRGFDTIGEEFILFVSVLGAIVLLHIAAERKGKLLPDAAEPWRELGASDATRLWVLVMVAPKITFGIYVVAHGQLTPGGGFQGGVIIASAALMLYVGEHFSYFRDLLSARSMEVAEAAGAAAFVVVGMLAWLKGFPYLTNFLPLGKANELTSGGTIPLISLAIGLEVAAGFTLLLYAFLQETLTMRTEE
jgi:multicomponent Na+:H+ antiporter subunit B